MIYRPTTIATRCCLATALLLLALAAEAAESETLRPALQLGTPFTDNAVLQRQMKLPVWGWSKPGTIITVEFAGQRKTATVDKRGNWMLKLDPLQASFEPAEMVISDSAGKTVTLRNILVGEVWMASGQSNMQWLVGKSSCTNLQVATKAEVAPIREFEVTSVYAALHPIQRAQGAWKSGDYNNYSAIAFAFAHKLYEELDVPIGILNCCFSQTAIEAWVPREGFADGDDEYTKSVYQKLLETDPTTPEHKAAWNNYYQGLVEAMEQNDTRIKQGRPAEAIKTSIKPGNLNGNRDATWMFNGRLKPVIPYAIRGAIWNQGYANMGAGLVYYNNLHSLVRGWRLQWDQPELPVYFHQFYCPGQKGGWTNNNPTIGSTAEMRLGTWLARDIPHTGMASQIDITGAIHYRHKAVPGQRLALHALKNQYGQDIVADGPMFKSYTVQGDKLIVEFEHAESGLVVAEAGSNALGKEEGATGFADPTIIDNGDHEVKIFYLAGEDRVWHRANMKIEGEKVVVTSPQVESPRGVSFATAGVAFQPSLYNRALLPASPFIYYDNKLVTSETWPDEKLKVAGEVIDPSTVGRTYDYRKMPLLSTQFRDNAVFQAGVPVTIWGSAIHDWGYEAEGKAQIKFSFADTEETIEVTPGMREWNVTIGPMQASAEPKTLKVTFTIDGKIVHERVCTNIVIGDVWYIAAPSMKMQLPAVEPSGQIVRAIKRKAKRSTSPRPSRYSVCVSTTPKNRFASEWTDASTGDLAGIIGHNIAVKTGKPVGIVFMQNVASKDGANPELKSWVAHDCLNQAPSLMADYESVGGLYPGNPYYNEKIHGHIADWKKYWGEYVSEMMATKSVPDGVAWGSYPTITAGGSDSTATQTYNVMVHSFTPAAFKGVVFLCSAEMFAKDQGANYGPELSALANCWKNKFGGDDPYFFYTIPAQELAAKITRPESIEGKQTAVEISQWSDANSLLNAILSEVYR